MNEVDEEKAKKKKKRGVSFGRRKEGEEVEVVEDVKTVEEVVDDVWDEEGREGVDYTLGLNSSLRAWGGVLAVAGLFAVSSVV